MIPDGWMLDLDGDLSSMGPFSWVWTALAQHTNDHAPSLGLIILNYSNSDE